ncbi:MAG: CvpA family protein [Clostridiales bacterium]|nr:CvpA family protein [Clostridiales bacterium]
MSWIDVAILALVVLVGLLGLWKCAKKSALSLGAFVISFILAFFLANVIAEALLGIDGIKNFVLGNGVGEKAQWSLAKMIYDGLGKVKLSEKSALWKDFYKPMFDVVNSSKAAITDTTVNPVNAGFALYGAFLIFSAICGVGIFIVVRLLLIIVTVIIKSYIGKKKTVVGRLLGFLFGAIRGALWMFAFTVVFTCFGGYTFLSGIKSIQGEYENNAVVCGVFNDWAYGLRNKLLLPDKDMYGRVVEMVYKKKATANPNAEKLAGDELKLYVNVRNLNYVGARFGIDNLKHRTEDTTISARSTAFESTEFDTVAQAILNYNKSIADKIDAKTTGLSSSDFGTYNDIVEGHIAGLMDDLWEAIGQYEYDYNNTEDDRDVSLRNSTLSMDYNSIKAILEDLAARYDPFKTAFGAFPELSLPEVKHFE